MRKMYSFNYNWMLKSSLIVALFFAFCGAVSAQLPFYWTVYGDNSGSSCTVTNRFNCTTTPASTSFSSEPTVVTTTVAGTFNPSTQFQNSIYDKAGQLLFSVNVGGIFDNTGTVQMAFNTCATSTGCASFTIGSTVLEPTYAVSEISIFPKPASCNSYYVLFWAADAKGYSAEIRCINVVVDPSTFMLTCTDGVIFDPSYGRTYTIAPGPGGATSPYSLVLVADDLNTTTGTRNFYTIEFNTRGAGEGTSTLRKWTFAADGTPPTTSFSYPAYLISIGSATPYQTPAYSPKAKILSLPPSAAATPVKYIGYISGDAPAGTSSPSTFGYYLQLLDLSTGLRIPDAAGFATNFSDAAGGYQTQIQLYGFDYSPAQNVIYCSYTDFSSYASGASFGTLNGGLAYWDSHGYVNLLSTTAVSSTSTTFSYRNTDLEIDKNDDLIMVNNPNSSSVTGSSSVYQGATEGQLAYLPVGPSAGAASTTAVPTIIGAPGCSAFPYVSVLNNIPVTARNLFGGIYYYGYYLGSQIRGESYTNGYDLLSYTASGGETWTPTNNPLSRAIGSPQSTICIEGDLHIPAGNTLLLQNMTLKMGANAHIYVDDAPATAPYLGGKLSSDFSVMTVNTTGCDLATQWQGVYLKGDYTQPQLSFWTTHQGAIGLQNWSTISNAVVGIQSGYGHTWPGLLPFSWWGHSPRVGDYASGGLITMNSSYISNCQTGIKIAPYRNFNPASPGVEIANASSFWQSVIGISDPTLPGTAAPVIGLYGQNVKGLNINSCKFENTTGIMDNTFGIYADNMGFSMAPGFTGTVTSEIDGFMEGIKHLSSINTNTPTVTNTTFNSNGIGADLVGSTAPLFYGNTFNVPYMLSGPVFYFIQPFGSSPTIAASPVGVILNTASNYIINGNTFNGNISTAGDYSSIGVLAYKTAGSPEEINNNNYNNLLAGNLSNYKNTNSSFYTIGSDYGIGSLSDGLQIKCNTNSGNLYDIAVRGTNFKTDGIDMHQGSSSLPGGNHFSSTGGGYTFNFYNPGPTTTTMPNSEVGAINYWFADPDYATWGVYPDPIEHPGQPSLGTAHDYGESSTSTDVLITGINATDHCVVSVGKNLDGTTPIYPGDLTVYNGTTLGLRLAAINNVNYYMNDSNGINHRDSLYYWASQIQTANGDRLLARLNMEDGNFATASSIYSNITTQYPLDQQEGDEYNIYGQTLMNMEISNMQSGALALTDDQITSLQDIYNNAPVWARAWAGNYIQSFADPATLMPGFAVMDIILLPVVPDSLGNRAAHNVTELATETQNVYPNPANDMLQVQFSVAQGTITIIEIDDVTGRRVITQGLDNGITQVDVSKLEPGLYFYKIIEGKTDRLNGEITKY